MATPSFPSLYWSTKAFTDPPPKHLIHGLDIWRFTFFWTLLIFEGVHLVVSLYALAVQWRNWKMMLLVGMVYMLVAGLEAVLAGGILGLILGAIYHAGNYQMSTWIPFVWGLINVLVLIVSSFAIQGGL